MNLPTFNLRRGNGQSTTIAPGSKDSLTYDEHLEETKRAQREADRWLTSGTLLMGTLVLGIIGLPVFLRGVWPQRRAQQAGLAVRPIIVTLIGYLVILDAPSTVSAGRST